jgi:hypothetical protein
MYDHLIYGISRANVWFAPAHKFLHPGTISTAESAFCIQLVIYAAALRQPSTPRAELPGRF